MSLSFGHGLKEIINGLPFKGIYGILVKGR